MDGKIENEPPWPYFFRYVHNCLQRLADVGEPLSREAEHTGEIQPLAHAVLLRALCSSEAIRLLLDRHLLIDATTLARGLSEAEMFLGALRVKPVEATERLREDFFVGRAGHAKVVKEILEARPQDRREAAKVVSETHAGQLIKWADFAKWIGDNRPYVVFKKFSSNAAHITAGSLGRHIELNDDKSAWSGYVARPCELTEVEHLAFECARALVKIGEAYAALLDIPSEVSGWLEVAQNFNARVLPLEEISAKSGL